MVVYPPKLEIMGFDPSSYESEKEITPLPILMGTMRIIHWNAGHLLQPTEHVYRMGPLSCKLLHKLHALYLLVHPT